MVIHCVITVVDHMVAVQVLDLHVSRIGDALGRGLDQCLVGMVVDIGLVLEQPLGYISPDFTYTLAGIVVVQVTCLVVIAVDGRNIVGQRTADLVVERFLRQCELVAPGQCDFPSFGRHVGIVAFGRRGTEHVGKCFTDRIHIRCLTDVIVTVELQAVVQHAEIQPDIGCRSRFPGQSVGHDGRSARVLVLQTVQDTSGSVDVQQFEETVRRNITIP